MYSLEFESVKYESGDKFTMMIPLTPDLEKVYGTKHLLVEDVVYMGEFDSDFVNAEREAGRLKVIFFSLTWDKHHMVSFGGNNWINDLLPHEGKDASFKQHDMTEN